MKKLLSAMVAHIAFLPLLGATYDVGMLQLPATTNITVEAGDTLRIEYLRGGTTLYKSGEGRLEVAVVANTNLAVVVSNGTFAAVKPTSLDFSDDEHVIFHLDANAASSVIVRSENGTNFVTEVKDADGRTDRKLTTLAGRPDAMLVEDGINGLPVIDLGTLHNEVADGYGAALEFNDPVSGAYEMLYVFEDDVNAKYRNKSIGPCPYGSPGTDVHVRGYVENGTNAPIHYKSISGRAQDGNYIDGVRYGSTGILFYTKPVPDGPHVMRNKINKITSSAFDDITGLGYSSSSKLLSYGGLKIGEVIFLSTTSEYNTLGPVAEVYHTYLMNKWLDVASVGKLTLLGDAVLDTSSAPLRCQVQWTSSASTVTDVKNLLPKGYYEAGNPVFQVGSAEYQVPERQSVVPGLSFAADAVLVVDSTATVARVDGVGAFIKKGGGNLLLGVHDNRLSAIDVQGGAMRVAPLEASGSFMHVDAAAVNTLTYAPQNGTNFITKWVDKENGVNYLQNTSTQYQFAKRPVGTPYISSLTQNALPLVDYGVYTSELYPDGNGGAFVPNISLARTGANAPGIHQMFVVWGDYDEIIDLPLHDGNELRGPGIIAGADGWGYRGYGGGGKTYPILGPEPKGSYHYTAGTSIKIDGASYDYDLYPYGLRPPKGLHVLDMRIGDLGAEVDYVGGCKWQNGYVGGNGSGVHPGVWGGVRIGEILIYRNLLPAYFRSRIAAVLGTKWFNRTNTLSYASVAVAPGASLAIPDTWVETQSLSLGGAFTAEEVATAALELTGDAVVEGRIVVADGATVSLSCGDDGKLPSLKADEFIAEGGFTVAIAMTPDQISSYAGRSFALIEGVSADFPLAKVKVKLSAAVKKHGVAAKLSVTDGVLAADIDFVGFSVIVR